MTDLSTRAPLVYKPVAKVRFVTAASLFDGHDASINIMRRILQATGCEVIHLGHNRSVEEIVDCAIQEDAHGIAVSSYQGGHVEFFTYMLDLLRERGAGHVKVFGGGGGVIVGAEIEALHAYGVTRIFSPEDGQKLGVDVPGLPQGQSQLVIGLDFLGQHPNVAVLHAELIVAGAILDVVRTPLLVAQRLESRERFLKLLGHAVGASESGPGS